MTTKLSSPSFYSEYHGHKLRHLRILYPLLRANSDALIWTAGDSSLDNKYWFRDRRPAAGCMRKYWIRRSALEEERGHTGGGSGSGSHNENRERVKKYAAIKFSQVDSSESVEMLRSCENWSRVCPWLSTIGATYIDNNDNAVIMIKLNDFNMVWY